MNETSLAEEVAVKALCDRALSDEALYALLATEAGDRAYHEDLSYYGLAGVDCGGLWALSDLGMKVAERVRWHRRSHPTWPEAGRDFRPLDLRVKC